MGEVRMTRPALDLPPGFRVRAGFDSGRDDCGERNGMGSALLPWSLLLFLPADAARHLAGISAGIGAN